jgi:hypothetical protein
MGGTESSSCAFSASNFTFFSVARVWVRSSTSGQQGGGGGGVCSAVLRCDVVGRTAIFVLTHPIDPASPYPFLHRADLGAGHAVMRYDREAMLVPSLAVLVPSSPLNLDGRQDGATLHPECQPVVPATGLLCRRISNLQAYFNEVGGVVVRFSWLLYFRFGSRVGGRLSIFPLLCESVGLYVGIFDGGGGLFFRSPIVWQPVAADCSFSPFLHMMVADVRSACMMWCGGVAGP